MFLQAVQFLKIQRYCVYIPCSFVLTHREPGNSFFLSFILYYFFILFIIYRLILAAKKIEYERHFYKYFKTVYCFEIGHLY